MPRLPHTNSQTKSENGRSASGLNAAYGTAQARASISRSRTRRGRVFRRPGASIHQIRRICFACAPLADARIPILDGGSELGRRFDQGALAGHPSEAAARSHTLRCRAPSQHDRLHADLAVLLERRQIVRARHALRSRSHGTVASRRCIDGSSAPSMRAAESALETRARSTGQDFFSRVAHARTSWTAAEY
jgi:hypothetical protein